MDVPQRVFTWWYRRLGKRYPAAFMAVELQTAWFITVGLLALLNLYYDVPHGDLLLVLAITLGLTAVTVFVSMGSAASDTCARSPSGSPAIAKIRCSPRGHGVPRSACPLSSSAAT